MKNILLILFILLITTGCDRRSKDDIIKEKREEALNLAYGGAKDKDVWIKNIAKAIKVYEDIIELNPDDVDIDYNDIGSLKTLINPDYQSAIINYTKSIEHNPKNSDSYYRRGSCKQHIEDYKGAISDLTIAIELDQYNMGQYNLRGWSKYRLGMFEEAILDFDTVIDVDAEYHAGASSGYDGRAHTKLMMGDTTDACIDFLKSKRATGSYVGAYDTLIRYCSQCKIFYQKDYIEMGWRETHLKNHENAIFMYSKAIEISPKDYKAYKYRGSAKMELKEYNEAIADYSKSIELVQELKKDGEESIMACYERGNAKIELGDTVGACLDWTNGKAKNMLEMYCN
jgi:tetratricopeptide (TPR) repeat protein